MKKIFAMIIVALSVTSTTQSVRAKTTSPTYKIPSTQQRSLYHWTSGYFGFHAGSALGLFDVSNPYGRSIYGDTIRVPALIGGVQAGYQWQLPDSRYVMGVETEISALSGEGTRTCFAYLGNYVSANGYASSDLAGKLTGRFGVAFGPENRILGYIKGGVAFLNTKIEVTNNHQFRLRFAPLKNTSTSMRWGGTLGAGLEFMLSPTFSINVEYDYLALAHDHVDAPESIYINPDFVSFTEVPSARANITEKMHQILFGINYHFYPRTLNHDFSSLSFSSLELTPEILAQRWQLETGLRYFYSRGSFQKNMPGGSISTSLISRLTYDHMDTHANELFARLDTHWHWFAKGFIGAGFITGGHMNDEDWGLRFQTVTVPYSNTFSDLDITKQRYATIDVGYNFLSGPDYRLGLFAGYNTIKERYTANDYQQIAQNPVVLFGTRVITETDDWQAMRVGFSAQAWLDSHWRLDLDLAYLPTINFRGEDQHWLRSLVINEKGSGKGAQIEVVASYCFNPRARIGLAGRYWAAWTLKGSDSFTDAQSGESVPENRLDTYRYERFGIFLQGSYLFS